MNHYINLLEPSECKYHSSAELNPLYKLGAAAMVMALVAWGYFSYLGLQSTIREGKKLETWLAENADRVKEAESRIQTQSRIQQARETLEGWRETRYDHNAIFTAMVREIPEPAERIQFTSLSFTEQIVGLTELRNNPAGGQTPFFPLERRNRIQLEGRIKSNQPEIVLDRYRIKLSRLSEALPIETITLRLGNAVEDALEEDDPETVTRFSADFELVPAELTP